MSRVTCTSGLMCCRLQMLHSSMIVMVGVVCLLYQASGQQASYGTPTGGSASFSSPDAGYGAPEDSYSSAQVSYKRFCKPLLYTCTILYCTPVLYSTSPSGLLWLRQRLQPVPGRPWPRLGQDHRLPPSVRCGVRRHHPRPAPLPALPPAPHGHYGHRPYGLRRQETHYWRPSSPLRLLADVQKKIIRREILLRFVQISGGTAGLERDPGGHGRRLRWDRLRDHLKWVESQESHLAWTMFKKKKCP